MKYHILILLAVLSLAISKIASGADSKEVTSVNNSVARLPFSQAVALPGALAISADGRIAAHISANRDIVIWDTSQLKPLETIPASDKKPSAIALSPDGNLLAIGYFDASLILRSRVEKKALRQFYGHSGAISTLAFSPDGKMLASGGADATTQLWEVNGGKRLHVFDSMFKGDGDVSSGIPVSTSFSGNGKVLLVNDWYRGTYDVKRSTTLWDIDDGIEISTREVAPPNHDEAMRAGQSLGGKGWLLAYTGGWLAGKHGLMVERLDQCEPARQLRFGGYADTVAADPQGQWVAAMGDDGKLEFSGLSGDHKTWFVTLPAKAIALVVHPDGRSVFALMINTGFDGNGSHISEDRGAEAVTEGALYRIPVPKSLWSSLPLSVKEAATHCRPTEAARLQQNFKVPEKPVELAVIAKLVPTKEMTSEENNPIPPPHELYFGQEGNLYALYLAQFTGGGGVAVWNLKASQLLRSRFEQSVPKNIIRLREGWGVGGSTLLDLLTGKRFSSVSNDDDKENHVNVTSDRDTGQIFRRTAKHFERYAADGRRLPDIKTKENVIDYAVRNGKLAVLYENGNVEVLQLEPGGKPKTYKLGLKLGRFTQEGYAGLVDELALSADGRYLRIAFPGEGDGETQYAIYRLSSAKKMGGGKLLTQLPVRANRGVVADTRPNHLAVWDYDKGEIIARLPRHRSRNKEGAYEPLRAAISDDGRLLASASHDGLVRIWDLDARQMIGEGRVGGAVATMAFDPVGRQLAAGRNDGQLLVFQVPDPK